MEKYLDLFGMKILWQNAKAYIDDLYSQKVTLIPGKQLSTNDYTDNDKMYVDEAHQLWYRINTIQITTNIDLLTANVDESNPIDIIVYNPFSALYVNDRVTSNINGSNEQTGIIINTNPPEPPYILKYDNIEIFILFTTRIIGLRLTKFESDPGISDYITTTAYKIYDIDLAGNKSPDIDALSGYKIVTQAEYDALETKDLNVIYFIKDEHN